MTSLSLNDKAYTKNWIGHTDLMKGGCIGF
ncbi:MAG: hypothetical protein WDO19_24725 [Bacteroidota bacterium]